MFSVREDPSREGFEAQRSKHEVAFVLICKSGRKRGSVLIHP